MLNAIYAMFFLSYVFYEKYENYNGYIYGIISAVFFIIAGLLSLQYSQSYYEAKYLNSNYGTNYSTEDMFWNSRLIKADLKAQNIIIDGSQNLNIKQTKE